MVILPLPSDFRNHLSEMSGNELKVWMAYFLSAGDEFSAHLSNETIEVYTGISVRTIKCCKRRLVLKGWLVYTGETKKTWDKRGQFKVNVMELHLPWRPEWKVTVAEYAEVADVVESLKAEAESTVVQNLPHGEPSMESIPYHRGANIAPPSVVQSLHPEGYGSSYGSGSDFSSSSHSGINVKVNLNACSEENGLKATTKPEEKTKTNGACVLVREPKPRAAKEGTPWPEDCNSWPNTKRVEWLLAHDPAAKPPPVKPRGVNPDPKPPIIPYGRSPEAHSASAPPVPPTPLQLNLVSRIYLTSAYLRCNG